MQPPAETDAAREPPGQPDAGAAHALQLLQRQARPRPPHGAARDGAGARRRPGRRLQQEHPRRPSNPGAQLRRLPPQPARPGGQGAVPVGGQQGSGDRTGQGGHIQAAGGPGDHRGLRRDGPGLGTLPRRQLPDF